MQNNKKEGFTLTEVLVVTTVIVIMTLAVLANQQQGRKEFLLQRAAHKLAQDIRRVQEMAMSARECPECSLPPQGYGIYFRDTSPNNAFYLVYADESGNEIYNSNEEIETVYLEEGVLITDINIETTDVNRVSINFRPPDPVIKIKQVQSDDEDFMEITISIGSGSSKKDRMITVNKAGLIDID